MPNTARSYTIQNNEAYSRFETTVEGHLSVVDYELDGSVLRITHTVVPPALEGRGIAGALVSAALAHARAHGLKVDAQCPYARSYMDRRPETHDLRA